MADTSTNTTTSREFCLTTGMRKSIDRGIYSIEDYAEKITPIINRHTSLRRAGVSYTTEQVVDYLRNCYLPQVTNRPGNGWSLIKDEDVIQLTRATNDGETVEGAERFSPPLHENEAATMRFTHIEQEVTRDGAGKVIRTAPTPEFFNALLGSIEAREITINGQKELVYSFNPQKAPGCFPASYSKPADATRNAELQWRHQKREGDYLGWNTQFNHLIDGSGLTKDGFIRHQGTVFIHPDQVERLRSISPDFREAFNHAPRILDELCYSRSVEQLIQGNQSKREICFYNYSTEKYTPLTETAQELTEVLQREGRVKRDGTPYTQQDVERFLTFRVYDQSSGLNATLTEKMAEARRKGYPEELMHFEMNLDDLNLMDRLDNESFRTVFRSKSGQFISSEVRPALSSALSNALETSPDGRMVLNLDKFKLSGPRTNFEQQTSSVLRELGVSDKDLIGHSSYGKVYLSEDTVQAIQQASPDNAYKISQLRPDLAPDLPSTQVPRSVASTLSEVGAEIPTKPQNALNKARGASPDADVSSGKLVKQLAKKIAR